MSHACSGALLRYPSLCRSPAHRHASPLPGTVRACPQRSQRFGSWALCSFLTQIHSLKAKVRWLALPWRCSTASSGPLPAPQQLPSAASHPQKKPRLSVHCEFEQLRLLWLGCDVPAQMRPGGGVKELLLTLLVSEDQLGVAETLGKFEPGS